MTVTKQAHKTPESGKPLITVISTGCKTPLLEVKFCSLVNPYRYPNSPTVKRYSVTCVVDPKLHKEFLAGLQSIEKDEKVDSIIKNETKKENDVSVLTGKLLVKFQTKDVIPVYIKNAKGEDEPYTLEGEFPAGEKVIVNYEILRYTKKNTMQVEHGISFKPKAIYWFPKGE